MEGLKRLRSARTAAKSAISRMDNYVSDPRALDSATVDVLQVKKEKMMTTFQSYELTQYSILEIDDQDEEDIEEVEEKYFNIIAKLNASINKLKEVNRPELVPLRLPAVEIPTFDGKDITRFKPFYELFQAVVHNNASLSDVQRLFYLRKYLVDEALSIIINLPLVNSSYKEAIDLLLARYENKARLIFYHINIILDIPNMQKGTAVDIRAFLCQVKQQLQALKNLDEPVDKWDMILISALSRKLDIATNRTFHMERNLEELPTMAEFISFLERRAIALEYSLDYKNMSHDNNDKEKFIDPQNTFGNVVPRKLYNKNKYSHNNIVCNLAICEYTNLENVMEQSWTTEKVPEESDKFSEDYLKAEHKFQNSVALKNNLTVDLPLLSLVNKIELEDSFSVAPQRFNVLEKRFRRNPSLLEVYKTLLNRSNSIMTLGLKHNIIFINIKLKTNLICYRSSVAPSSKVLTIPQLEIISAVLLVRIKQATNKIFDSITILPADINCNVYNIDVKQTSVLLELLKDNCFNNIVTIELMIVVYIMQLIMYATLIIMVSVIFRIVINLFYIIFTKLCRLP